MIRTIVISSILLMVCNFIQSTWFGAIALWGVIPDLALVVLVWLSYKNGLVEGPMSGFISGFAEDCLSASPLGFHALVKTAVAALAGLLHGSFFIDRVFLPFVLGFLATLAKAIIASGLNLLFGAVIQPYNFLDKVIWIESAYNGLIAPLVFLLLGLARKLLVTDSNRE
jgi:rod shape-determining protein MreD